MKYVFIMAIIAIAILWYFLPEESSLKQASTYQSMVSPGELSEAHAFLGDNCAACHTPVSGVKSENCAVCHANNHEILNRQPTAFHADVQECTPCHLEHKGYDHHPTKMNHSLLSKIGIKELDALPNDKTGKLMALQLNDWVKRSESMTDIYSQHAGVEPLERVLNCATCHSNDDVHVDYFGKDCVSCHATTQWTIAAFKHPSASSTSCNQCHQAPPSHYMMHFKMISAKVAGKPHAKLEQCHACHQTTSWNDIIDVGMYKHH